MSCRADAPLSRGGTAVCGGGGDLGQRHAKAEFLHVDDMADACLHRARPAGSAIVRPPSRCAAFSCRDRTGCDHRHAWPNRWRGPRAFMARSGSMRHARTARRASFWMSAAFGAWLVGAHRPARGDRAHLCVVLNKGWNCARPECGPNETPKPPGLSRFGNLPALRSWEARPGPARPDAPSAFPHRGRAMIAAPAAPNLGQPRKACILKPVSECRWVLTSPSSR